MLGIEQRRVYRVAQVAKAYGKKVLVRLEKRTARRLQDAIILLSIKWPGNSGKMETGDNNKG